MKVKFYHALFAVVLAVVLTVYGCRVQFAFQRPVAGRPITGTLNLVKDASDKDGYVTVIRLIIFDGENNAEFVNEIDSLVGKRVILRIAGE